MLIYVKSFLFDILFSIHLIKCTQILEGAFTLVVDRISMGISLGSSKQIAIFKSIDMETPFSYFGGDSSYCKNISQYVMLNDEYISCNVYEAPAYIRGGFNMSWVFYNTQNFADKTKMLLKNGIGFGYEQTPQNAFYNQLWLQGLINKPSFSFVKERRVEGTIYFGGLPSMYTDNKSKMTCKIRIHKGNKWLCTLKEVIITSREKNGSVIYINETNDYINFQSSQGFILVPEYFMSELNKTFFHKQLQNKNCVYYKRSEFFKNYDCKTEIIHLFPDITFIIGDYKQTFNYTELFRERFRMGEFLIYTTKGNSKWMFGGDYLLKYISEFDYQEKEVRIYSSEKQFEFVGEEYIYDLKIVQVVVTVICALGFAQLIVILVLKGERENFI